MVLTHSTNHTYSHPFPTVTLAYFLRYSSPQLNPFANHVLSTDTISSHVDPTTQRLYTTRIHLKKSRMPGAIYKLLPSGMMGGGSGGEKASYILETSVVDIKEGWMKTESKNLNFTGVLSVIEQQHFTLPSDADRRLANTETDVTTSVVFRSRLGEKIRGRIGQAQEDGWFSGFMGGWGAKGIQRSIESIASTKSQDQLGKSRDGMRLVLERIRNNGVIGVLETLRRERQSQGQLA
jgi:4-amino-4-deoxychorismate lyase